MVKVSDMPLALGIVILCRNESHKLPLLLADLQRWPAQLEIWVSDGCSDDDSCAVARLGGAQVLQISPPSRGFQLQRGCFQVRAPWLLLLHADSRLPSTWPAAVCRAMLSRESLGTVAWFFDFRVSASGLSLRLLEWAVAIRSCWLQQPYGDQGLLLKRNCLENAGGIRPLPIMEDLDLVQRLRRQGVLRRLGLPVFTDGRRWQQRGVLNQAWRNAQLRRRWRRGEDPQLLARMYHSH